jgi:hypothetical protein
VCVCVSSYQQAQNIISGRFPTIMYYLAHFALEKKTPSD